MNERCREHMMFECQDCEIADLRAQLAEREGQAASLADCINQALREAGGLDHLQVTNYLGDMRPAVEQLSFRIGQQAVSLAEREGEIKRLALARDEAKREAEQAKFVYRFGTPFDPTGAKTGTEILSLRDGVKRLTEERDAAEARLARMREALEEACDEIELLVNYVMHNARAGETDEFMREKLGRLRLFLADPAPAGHPCTFAEHPCGFDPSRQCDCAPDTCRLNLADGSRRPTTPPPSSASGGGGEEQEDAFRLLQRLRAEIGEERFCEFLGEE